MSRPAEPVRSKSQAQEKLGEHPSRLSVCQSHGEAAARGLRALEPFIERVTSRCSRGRDSCAAGSRFPSLAGLRMSSSCRPSLTT